MTADSRIKWMASWDSFNTMCLLPAIYCGSSENSWWLYAVFLRGRGGFMKAKK